MASNHHTDTVFIYLLELKDNTVYIGKTVNPSHRLCSHKKSKNIVQFDIIDTVFNHDWKYWEKFYIELFKTWNFKLDNKNNGGGGPSKGRYLRSKDQNWKDNLSKSHKGKIITLETCLKMSKSHLNKPSNFKGKTHTPQTCNIISKSLSKSVLQYDTYGNILNTFSSIKEAAIQTNTNKTSISGACLGKYKKVGGYIWKYNN
jgi:hypothetical protein